MYPNIWILHRKTQNRLIANVDLKCVQHVSCQFKFYWGQMKTAAWETAPQTALRNCSQEVGQKVSVYEILVTEEYMKPGTYSSRRFLLVSWSSCWSWGTVISMTDFTDCLDMGRYMNWAPKIGSWEYLTIWRPVLPVFPPAQGASLVLSTLNYFRGVEGQQLQ